MRKTFAHHQCLRISGHVKLEVSVVQEGLEGRVRVEDLEMD